MKNILINQPHLQSKQQKLGSAFLICLSWSLWFYFLLPLFTLAGWLFGVKSLSDEIRWFGGYKTLLELLQIYAGIIVVIIATWIIWSFLLSWIHASIKPEQHSLVGDQDLAKYFDIEEVTLRQVRSQQKIDVYFDDSAHIIKLE